jgi:hypothetical protein
LGRDAHLARRIRDSLEKLTDRGTTVGVTESSEYDAVTSVRYQRVYIKWNGELDGIMAERCNFFISQKECFFVSISGHYFKFSVYLFWDRKW